MRYESSMSNLAPFDKPALGKRSTPYVRSAPDTAAESFEIVFFARTRPLRVRVRILHEGRTPLA